jgi:hypothetical protein
VDQESVTQTRTNQEIEQLKEIELEKGSNLLVNTIKLGM